MTGEWIGGRVRPGRQGHGSTGRAGQRAPPRRAECSCPGRSRRRRPTRRRAGCWCRPAGCRPTARGRRAAAAPPVPRCSQSLRTAATVAAASTSGAGTSCSSTPRTCRSAAGFPPAGTRRPRSPAFCSDQAVSIAAIASAKPIRTRGLSVSAGPGSVTYRHRFTNDLPARTADGNAGPRGDRARAFDVRRGVVSPNGVPGLQPGLAPGGAAVHGVDAGEPVGGGWH